MDETHRIAISVVMSVYGETPIHLAKAIDSILGQTFRDLEFIIVADAPKNDALMRVLEEMSESDERIILLRNTSNLGLAASLNRGIDVARGKYIARMDADDISDPSRLRIQYDYLEANKKVDFLFSWVDYIGQDDKYIRTFSPDRGKVTHIRNHFFCEHLLVHPTLLCRTEAIRTLRYDPTFMRSQDFELWMRAIQKYKFDLIPQTLLQYRTPAVSDISGRIKKMRDSTHWTMRALWKNRSFHTYNVRFWKFWIKTIEIWTISRLPVLLLQTIIKTKDATHS